MFIFVGPRIFVTFFPSAPVLHLLRNVLLHGDCTLDSFFLVSLLLYFHRRFKLCYAGGMLNALLHRVLVLVLCRGWLCL